MGAAAAMKKPRTVNQDNVILGDDKANRDNSALSLPLFSAPLSSPPSPLMMANVAAAAVANHLAYDALCTLSTCEMCAGIVYSSTPSLSWSQRMLQPLGRKRVLDHSIDVSAVRVNRCKTETGTLMKSGMIVVSCPSSLSPFSPHICCKGAASPAVVVVARSEGRVGEYL